MKKTSASRELENEKRDREESEKAKIPKKRNEEGKEQEKEGQQKNDEREAEISTVPPSNPPTEASTWVPLSIPKTEDFNQGLHKEVSKT